MEIIVIEDEIRIREGLTKLIGKIDPTYQVVGEAENGLEGIRLIREKKPQVIITDIRMPDLDGLDMIKILRNENNQIKVILLSAYSDFAYAQEAIKLGVCEYLLKPISVNEVTKALKNAERLIQERKKEKDSLVELKSLENIFYGILYSGLEVSEELCSFLQYQYQIDPDKKFILIPVYLGELYESNHKRMERGLVAALLEKGFQTYVILALPQSSSLLLILYGCENFSQIERWFQNRVVAGLEQLHSFHACFGWIEVTGVLNIKENLLMLQKHMDWNLVLGSEIMISYPKIKQIQTVLLSYPIYIETSMREALCTMDSGLVLKIMLDFILYFKSGAVYSPREVKESFIRFLWSIINVIKEIDYETFCNIEQQKLLEQVMSAVTYQELECFMECFMDLITRLHGGDMKNQSLITQRVKSLIHEFYNQGITLDEIADKLQRTPEYLGSQFHKETGMTYSIYLRDYRILKAKELLIGTRLKSYEVASQVGYNDPKYFAKVFKRVTGDQPVDYRKNHK